MLSFKSDNVTLSTCISFLVTVCTSLPARRDRSKSLICGRFTGQVGTCGVCMSMGCTCGVCVGKGQTVQGEPDPIQPSMEQGTCAATNHYKLHFFYLMH